MELKNYQDEAHKFASYKDPLYPLLGLQEEVGELSGKFAKAMRGDYIIIDNSEESISAVYSDKNKEAQKEKFMFTSDIQAEVGDILWMLSEICTQRGWNLNAIAENNIKKLQSRFNRNLINGEGDNR